MDKRHEQSLMYMINKINESIFAGSVKAIILYGSCARGNAKYTSDVDILVEVDESVKQINGYKRAALDLVSEGHCIPDDLPDVDIRFQFGDWIRGIIVICYPAFSPPLFQFLQGMWYLL